MIDFTFTEEQKLFRKAASDFSDTVITPQVHLMESDNKHWDEVVKAMGEAEMYAITIPKDFGGLDLGYTERIIAVEEIARKSVASAMMMQVFGLGIDLIVRFGNEAQKREYLPKLAAGESLATLAITELTGGSDPKSGRSKYKKEGTDYVLNGRKIFITNSHLAHLFIILASDEENPDTYSTFLVEKNMEGFKPTYIEQKVGMRGCNTGEIEYKNVRIPRENLLGKEGEGLRVAMSGIGDTGRGGMVGCGLGLHSACLEESIKFAKERVLYGKPIGNLQAIQFKIADMKIELEAGRLLGYRAAAMQDKGERASNEFAAAKYFITEAAQRAAKNAADIHGGYGCMEEYPVTRYLRDSFVLGPSSGTSDIMKIIVSRWAMG